MSFIPKAFGGLASGLIDGKKGAFSNVGNMVGGPVDLLGIGNATQRLVDSTGANGKKPGPYVGASAADAYKPRGSTPTGISGRGATSLSV